MVAPLRQQLQKYPYTGALTLAKNITRFFYKKTIFLPEPQFSEHNARNQAEIFLIFFLNFYLFVFFNSIFN